MDQDHLQSLKKNIVVNVFIEKEHGKDDETELNFPPKGRKFSTIIALNTHKLAINTKNEPNYKPSLISDLKTDTA